MNLGEMEGVSEELLILLEQIGIATIEQLADSSLDRLREIPGMEEEALESLLATARVTRDELRKMIEKTIAEEIQREAAEDRPLFDEDALDEHFGGEGGAGEDADAPSPTEEDIFGDFPGKGDQDGVAAGAEAGEGDGKEKKLDPFANSELED
jgi:hypothetical protein